jgi:hypothetical protein
MAGEANKITITGTGQTKELGDTSPGTAGQMGIQVTGTFSAGAISIEGSNDGGTTKVPLLIVPWGSVTTQTTIVANGGYRVDGSCVKRIYVVSDGSFSGSISLWIEKGIG